MSARPEGAGAHLISQKVVFFTLVKGTGFFLDLDRLPTY